MAVKSAARSPSASSFTDQDKRWESIYQHLERGEYNHLIRDLQKLSETKSPTYSPYIESIIKTAKLLCLACIRFREESDWHKKANAEADLREEEFLQQLYSVLNLIETDSENELVIKADQASVSSLSATSLKARLQSLLGIMSQIRTQDLELPGSSISLAHRKDSVFDNPIDSVEQHPPKLASETDILPELELDKAIIPTTERDIFKIPKATKASTINISNQVSPSLRVYCLGQFRLYQDGQQVTDWLSNKGKMIFKYLIMHREHPIPKEILMDLFWSNTNPDAARNNLNVAIYGLRHALRKSQPNYSHILFQNDEYALNPKLQIWVDVEEFEKNLAGAKYLESVNKPADAFGKLETAINLYQGEFLAGDIYEEWTVIIRERLRLAYLNALHHLSRHYFQQKQYDACVTLCQSILARDRCREDVHCLLMRCFAHQGQIHLGLRQYQICVTALDEELEVGPSESTVALYDQLRRREITKT